MSICVFARYFHGKRASFPIFVRKSCSCWHAIRDVIRFFIAVHIFLWKYICNSLRKYMISLDFASLL